MGWNDFRIYGGHASFSEEKLVVLCHHVQSPITGKDPQGLSQERTTMSLASTTDRDCSQEEEPLYECIRDSITRSSKQAVVPSGARCEHGPEQD